MILFCVESDNHLKIKRTKLMFIVERNLPANFGGSISFVLHSDQDIFVLTEFKSLSIHVNSLFIKSRIFIESSMNIPCF